MKKNMYENASSSTQQDELSLFLHQILLCSSSSSSSAAAASSPSFMSAPFVPDSSYFPPSRPMFVSGEPLSSSCGVTFSDSADYFPGNVSYSSVGPIENNNGLDEYDCESEEGHVDLGEEVTVRPVSYRHSSKRTRAAEVHNMSEKRRRSKINEKMKALQKLIPNSNKTDKASMLDEAIEYLKQLQLQVQRLSMRSGRGMRPMCLPGIAQPHHLSQMRMSTHSMNQEIPSQSFPLNLPLIPNTIQIVNPETSFGLESSIPSRLESVQFHTSHERNSEGGVVLKTDQNYKRPIFE